MMALRRGMYVLTKGQFKSYRKALKIAKRLEQINALSFESIAKMYCNSGECHRFPECCSHRKNDTYCENALIFAKSYDQALLDIRGDTE